jgi:hypothetical protein
MREWTGGNMQAGDALANAAFRANQKASGVADIVGDNAYDSGRRSGMGELANMYGTKAIANALGTSEQGYLNNIAADGVYNFNDGSMLTGLTLNKNGSVASLEKTALGNGIKTVSSFDGAGNLVQKMETGNLPSNTIGGLTMGAGTRTSYGDGTSSFRGDVNYKDKYGNAHSGWGEVNYDNNGILSGSVTSGTSRQTVDVNDILNSTQETDRSGISVTGSLSELLRFGQSRYYEDAYNKGRTQWNKQQDANFTGQYAAANREYQAIRENDYKPGGSKYIAGDGDENMSRYHADKAAALQKTRDIANQRALYNDQILDPDYKSRIAVFASNFSNELGSLYSSKSSDYSGRNVNNTTSVGVNASFSVGFGSGDRFPISLDGKGGITASAQRSWTDESGHRQTKDYNDIGLFVIDYTNESIKAGLSEKEAMAGLQKLFPR